MSIDYDKSRRQFTQQKSALTRAVNSGDYDKIVATCRKTVREWDDIGPWPDDWSRWQRALEDAYWAARQKYIRDEIEELPEPIALSDLRWDEQNEPQPVVVASERLGTVKFHDVDAEGQYTITLTMNTDAESPAAAAAYFAEAITASGLNVTVTNDATGESTEVEL